MTSRRLHTACKCIHRLENYADKTTTTGTLSKSVFISENHNIFVNLALEEWLYKNCDFSNRQILLLWRNTRAVVIGRHQNPWLELNSRRKDGSALTVVRRNSGGGAVYHDFENLNLSFLTSKKEYCRKYNLQTIIEALRKEWNIICNLNDREDIVLDGRKVIQSLHSVPITNNQMMFGGNSNEILDQVSGTASKLSSTNAYHHCTLLVDVDKTAMSTALHSKKVCQRLLVFDTFFSIITFRIFIGKYRHQIYKKQAVSSNESQRS